VNGSWNYKGGDGEGAGSSGVVGQEDVSESSNNTYDTFCASSYKRRDYVKF